MIEDCPETDIEFDAPRFTSAHELRRARMLLLPGNARRSSIGRGDGACSAQRGLRAG